MVCLQGSEIQLHRESVVTVGKFESLHRGHRSLLETVAVYAKAEGLASVVLTFEPHPYCVLADPAYKPLFTLAERAYLLDGLGMDYLVACPFDTAFMQQTPEMFCDMIFDRLRGRRLVVGEGYRFGKDRAGTTDTLIREARKRGCVVSVMPSLHTQAPDESTQRISTSFIRQILTDESNADAPTLAADLLGRRFFVMGTVAEGRRIGRTIGFPTVNLLPDAHKFLPANGVYITQTRHGERLYPSVTNVGLNPTVSGDGAGRRTVETYLFDFQGNMYGEQITVEFIAFVRRERKFDSVETLRAQIASDIENVARYFGC